MIEPNKERLLELADRIEKLPHSVYFESSDTEDFNMSAFVKGKSSELSCKTACCLAGWAVALFGPEVKDKRKIDYIREAEKLLGLHKNISYMLFFACNIDLSTRLRPSLITPQEAARACRNVADGARTFMFIWES